MAENTEKKEIFEAEVILFDDYKGNRVYSDKRMPDGRIRLYLPSPEVNFPDAVNDLCKEKYNRTAQELFDMGVRQHAYAERDWDILKKQNDAKTSEEIVANITEAFGPTDNLDEFIAKAKEFFETALYIEKRERTASVEKQAVTKLKAAGVNLAELDQDMIDKIIAAQNKKAKK